MYAVFRTQKYEKLFNKVLSSHEQREIEDFELKLAERPYLGDSLGTPFFREKKIDGKRVYFIIYDDLKVVCMMRISTKKNQQETIDEIKRQMYLNKEFVKQLAEYGRV
jgi:hypothetical protein